MLMRWDPFFEASRLDPTLARALGTRWKAFEPAVDIFDEEGAIVLVVEVPGMTSEDLQVQVEGNLLTLSGERRQEPSQGKVHRTERAYGAFRRSFTLPKTVDGDAIDASLKDGILTLRLPKKGGPEKRRIEVKSHS